MIEKKVAKMMMMIVVVVECSSSYHVFCCIPVFHRVSLFCTMSYHYSNYPISYPPLSCIIMSISSHDIITNYRRLAEMMMMMVISVGGLHTAVVY